MQQRAALRLRLGKALRSDGQALFLRERRKQRPRALCDGEQRFVRAGRILRLRNGHARGGGKQRIHERVELPGHGGQPVKIQKRARSERRGQQPDRRVHAIVRRKIPFFEKRLGRGVQDRKIRELFLEQRAVRQTRGRLSELLRRDERALHLGKQLGKLRAEAASRHGTRKCGERPAVNLRNTAHRHGNALAGQIRKAATAVFENTLGQPLHGQHLHADESRAGNVRESPLRGERRLLRHDDERPLAALCVRGSSPVQRVRLSRVRPADQKCQSAHDSILSRCTGS